MSVNFTILGSGSAGNCTYLETSTTRLLIDAGFSGKQIRTRLATINRDAKDLTGIIITHEHSDHIAGLVGLASKADIPIYCNRLTKQAIEQSLEIKLNCHIFNTGATFEIGDIGVDAFSVPHDAYDPVNFFFRTPEGNIGFLTDLGHVTKLVMERVRTSHVLLIESNHDLKMLQEDIRRPWSLKQRIMSRHGHLSNESAAEAVEQILSAELRQIYLGHLSRDCNTPEAALKVMNERLKRNGATHITVQVASQTEPCPTLAISKKADA